MPLLVLDLQATSRNWRLTPAAERAIIAAAPPGWRVANVTAPTSSDGDGAAGPSDEALDLVRTAEAYVGFGMSRPLFAAAPRVRWVHSAAAGVAGVLYDEMRTSDVTLTNSAGVHAIPIAEYVVAGVLYLLRGFDMAVSQQRAGIWDKSPFVREGSVIREMGECRALIVGAGGLGSAIGARLSLLGAHCTGVRRRPELGPPPGFERVVGPDTLDNELPSADIVVLCAPFTPSTRDLMTAERLARLPAGAIVVNVARGALLDEVALADGIRAGRLRGAVLDVFREEPLAPDSPLWLLPSVLVTPHVSPVSPGRFWERELALILENWGRYTRGEPLVNVVDKAAGY